MRGWIPQLIKLVIFLVVTTFATYVLAATISNTSFGSTNSYKANFTDASGIQDGDDVRIAGVRVGTVSGIKLICCGPNKDRISQIAFTVVKSTPLPTTVAATIRYRNLVGQRYLEISYPHPGDTNARIKPGGTIPLKQTVPALDLTDLFDGFQPLVQGLDAGAINQLSNEIVMALQGEGGAIDTLFATVGQLTNSLADKGQVIDDLITNLSTTLNTVAAHDTELSNLIIQLRAFVSGFASDRVTIGNAITSINGLATTTSGLLAKARGPLAKDITDLTGLVGSLNANSADVQYVSQNLAPTVAALIRTASYGSWFNFYLCSVNGFITLPGGKVQHIALAPGVASRCK